MEDMTFLSADYQIPHRSIIVPIGIPASGKTSLRYEILSLSAKQNREIKIISPDEIRFRLLDFDHTGVSFDERIEPEVWQTAMFLLGKYIGQGKTVFFDATNISKSDRRKIISKVADNNYKIECHYLPIHPEYAIWRDTQRGQGTEKRSVSPNIIYMKYFALQVPDKSEGFTEIFVHEQKPTKEECHQMNGIWNEKTSLCQLKITL